MSTEAIEVHFVRQMWLEVHHSGLVLVRKCPGSPGTCNPDQTGLPWLPLSSSPTLFFGSGPVGLPPVHWTGKYIENTQFFVGSVGHCCRGDLIRRTIF